MQGKITNTELITKLYFIKNFKLGVFVFPNEADPRQMGILFIEPAYLENNMMDKTVIDELLIRYNKFYNSLIEGIDIKGLFNTYRMEIMDEKLVIILTNEITTLLNKKYNGYLKEALRFEFDKYFLDKH